MISTDLKKFDRRMRKELGVPPAAWLRQVDATKTELRIGDNIEPLASASDEGGGRWCVRLPDQVVFVGDPWAARTMLWKAAADAPTRPAAAPRPGPPRRGWDYYSRAD